MTDTLILALRCQAGFSVDVLSVQYLFKVLRDWGAHIIRRLAIFRELQLSSAMSSTHIHTQASENSEAAPLKSVVLTGRHFTRVLRRGYSPSR